MGNVSGERIHKSAADSPVILVVDKMRLSDMNLRVARYIPSMFIDAKAALLLRRIRQGKSISRSVGGNWNRSLCGLPIRAQPSDQRHTNGKQFVLLQRRCSREW